MKSWLSFLLPDDEYKERRLLYFFSEGAIILFLTLLLMIISNRIFHLEVETALLISIAIFLFYVSGRYILSGMEYTDIATVHSYKREIKHIFSKTCSFTVIFMLLYVFVEGIPNDADGWISIVGLIVSVSFVWFITSYISLKRSYKKNKELL